VATGEEVAIGVDVGVTVDVTVDLLFVPVCVCFGTFTVDWI
jgi:hypothetical protein